ncbi:hypothetical protein [Burkholderia vietnamiensis]|uniref:hypothetical protein n=1 Tax=Burkholderia vietnamiensis TaxID=60552 RepID=UPI00352F2C9F
MSTPSSSVTISTPIANRAELAEAFGQNQSAIRRLEAMTKDITSNLPAAIDGSLSTAQQALLLAEALQQVAFVLGSPSAEVPNASVLTQGAGMSITFAAGAVTIALQIPVSIPDGGTGASDAATARGNLGAAASGANSDITSLSGLTTPIAISEGGTGAFSALTARGNLAAAASGANSDITSLYGLTTALSVSQGGTGATGASGARGNLGAAASGANSDITSLTGLTTPLAPTEGGTGVATLTPNGVIVGNGGGPLHATAVGTAGQMLISQGAGNDPVFSNGPTISGGTIDGANIGQTTPAKGAFTQLKNGETVLMHSTVALANGAGAAAGTLANAPAAGNPTKWIAIDDNGTTRYVPAW